MDKDRLEQIEINLLLEAIYQRYGYDFRNYARASVERRARQLRERLGAASIGAMIPMLLHDKALLGSVLKEFSITVTEMFRDPFVYRGIRQEIVPMLKTYPYIKVWLAGCATGEEAYSLAILLREEGLQGRAIIYATDFNDVALDKARAGIYELERLKVFTANYLKAGGRADFGDYYHARYGAAVMRSELKKDITFANHNLVTDGVFGEMHLIVCRNVLIYFNKELQARVLGLFRDSLVFDGFLCLGAKETLKFSSLAEEFKVVDPKAKLFQKKVA